MEILRTTNDLNVLINKEIDFQTNAGWEESLIAYEEELLKKVTNPIENYETVRYIHKPYDSSGLTQTDIWFYFYFIDNNNLYDNGLDYNLVGITSQENEHLLKQSTKSFFRLEFYKTPGTVIDGVLTCEPPSRINRKLIFAKNLSLPLGEKYFYTTLNGYIHLPVFQGSNYENKENMYFFWFVDESVLTETNLSGSTTGNTFFMTAKFYNAKDGSILDFTNSAFTSGHTINESNDMYYQVDIDKTDYSYYVYSFNGTKGNRIGTTESAIKFYEKRGAISNVVTPTPTMTPTITPTPTPTPTPPLTSVLLDNDFILGTTATSTCPGTGIPQVVYISQTDYNNRYSQDGIKFITLYQDDTLSTLWTGYTFVYVIGYNGGINEVYQINSSTGQIGNPTGVNPC
jgi:hypothetical protein